MTFGYLCASILFSAYTGLMAFLYYDTSKEAVK